MQLNKKEKEAVEALKSIAAGIEDGEPVFLTASQQNALINVLGYDVQQATCMKKEVKEFRRGKDAFHLIFGKSFASTPLSKKLHKFGYFPFQVKEKR